MKRIFPFTVPPVIAVSLIYPLAVCLWKKKQELRAVVWCESQQRVLQQLGVRQPAR